jgi:peptidoglycan-associated lipoprotein
MIRKNFLSVAFIALLTTSCSHHLLKNAKNKSVKAPAQEIEKKAEIKPDPQKSKEQIIFFEYNSSKITEEAIAILNDEILPKIKNSKAAKIKIEGYCDERGSASYNKKLGKKRADSVKAYLVKNGVKSSRIKVLSYGKLKPADSGHNEKAWAKNRRAVVLSIKNDN